MTGPPNTMLHNADPIPAPKTTYPYAFGTVIVAKTIVVIVVVAAAAAAVVAAKMNES